MMWVSLDWLSRIIAFHVGWLLRIAAGLRDIHPPSWTWKGKRIDKASKGWLTWLVCRCFGIQTAAG